MAEPTQRHYRPITPPELRAAAEHLAAGDAEAADVMERAAQTIEHYETALADAKREMARVIADSTPMAVATAPPPPPRDVVAQWLSAADPIEVEEVAGRAIVRSVVEANRYAILVCDEAVKRSDAISEYIMNEVAQLELLIANARGSMERQAALPNELHQWQGQFTSRLRVLLDAIEMPYTEKISEIAKLLTLTSSARLPNLDDTYGPQ